MQGSSAMQETSSTEGTSSMEGSNATERGATEGRMEGTSAYVTSTLTCGVSREADCSSRRTFRVSGLKTLQSRCARLVSSRELPCVCYCPNYL